ncbi:efflux RND transporter permease subunit [Flammeovirgaceae bacterium SG7u.111]|nr:efflux RND transporter permease subunit [Flammeovirgaceae bacterium SG7u.132]WPO37518.1 efflux RND transporter permease subunit [Flammeovirgaceae bacterium SG7u.111]
MIKTFIERPVLSTVVSIFIVLLGVLGIAILPVTQYPDIAPPTITISATYTGADAETVLKSVITPIEEQVNGVENMTYITSTASNSGSANISVFFKQGTDPDIAAVNVQNRVARATPLLPSEVTRFGVVTQKRQTSSLMFMSFYSLNEEYDDVFIQNYLNINIVPALKRINGVGEATVFGAKDYAMRVWLKPDRLANFGLVPSDVISAINEQSTQAAPGQLGQNNGEAFQYVIKYSGKYNDVSQYEDIVIKTGADGRLLKLKDVAEIELSAFSYASTGETDGNPSLTLAIYQTPGSNAQEIIENITAFLEENRPNFPKGIDYLVNYDTNEFLTASLNKVLSTLLEAFVLVFIVVFIFLQDFRSTLIPAIAVPVSIIGTFFFLNLFGFSINLLTLFALVLAIGIVVDDAIVVVEAVHAKLEKSKGEGDIKKITNNAMSGITAAIISITLVMAAVFIPVTFISGSTGVFYQQFGITLVIAIFISAVNALTLSPMLCALFLKPHSEEEHKKGFVQRFYDAFNTIFNALSQRYVKVVGFIINRKWIAYLSIAASAGVIWWVSQTTPTGFVPNEDRKLVFGNIELPAGSSLDRTYKVLTELNDEASQIPGVAGLSFVIGRSLINGEGNNYGLALIRLKDWKERGKDKSQSIEAITGRLFALNMKIPEARLIFFSPPSVPGFSISSGFEVQLLDKGGSTIKELDETAQNFMGELMKRPEILYSQSSLNTKFPQYELKINVDLAKQKGVAISSIFSALSGYVGGVYAADFNKFGKQYRVMVQSLPEERNNKESLDKIYIRNNNGNMSPITEYVSLERVYGPQSVSRFNLFTSAAISGAPAEGYSTGDAIRVVQEVAQQTLPPSYDIDFSGLTREEISSGSQTIVIFMLAVVFVFLLLSAQYESYIVPFSIILSLPIGVMGAFAAQKFAGLENNIYFQIALIMLIGLLAKNAILIVEFALQERKNGHSIVQAAILGAKERLRPILMTSFAFIVGLMPLVLATGVGAVGNRSLATGAVFGLLVGTVLGLLIIPTFFVIFQTLQEKIKPIKFSNETQHETQTI